MNLAIMWFDPASSWFGLLAQAFPRGPGFYFSLWKLVPVLAVYFAWARVCWWVDKDSQELELRYHLWNSVLLGCGLFGLLMVWVMPWFFLSFTLLLTLCAAPTIIYVSQRNQLVDPEDRVLTWPHIYRLLRLKPPEEEDEGVKNLPIRLIGKSQNTGDDDQARVTRAQQSKGYKAALGIIWEAVQGRATDIHLEPTKDEMTIRLRVDGIMKATNPFTRSQGDAVLNIFKVLAALDITEKRKPQDGSFSAQVEAREFDFRVATAGSVVGEKMVMRLLDRTKTTITLTDLGMRDKIRDQVRGIVSQPHGMFIVCGPTGSGKSTTLYACMREIDRYTRNVITLENPVEYHIDNVTQIEINPKAGKTFASELRSILRQDPDVIYVGEIRDKETAEIACQAAQTGHMVFTTLHANDTVTAMARLLDLGVQPFMVANAVSAVLGQRLVRVLCPKCKVRYKPDPDMVRKANLPADRIKFFYRPPTDAEALVEDEHGERSVCPRCGGTGYQGRTGIFELLVVNDAIREMIKENPNFNAIRQEAVKTGLKYLQEDGLRQVIEGKTSIQELLRVSK